MSEETESKAIDFIQRFGGTVLWVLCVVLIAVVLWQMSEQNDKLETQQVTIATQQKALERLVADYSVIVTENEEFIERTLATECEIRAEGRETVREVFFGVLDQFDETSEEVVAIRTLIDTDFPEIECPEA